MYNNAKSYIRNNNINGEMFNCGIGVRQGENLSPLLFALYLNDLQEFLSHAYNGLQTVSDLVKEQTETADTITYLKLFVILYADDTVILAESIPELQAALNGMNHYCVMWKLKINTMKTKVVIFSRQKVKERPKFMLGENELEIVDEYKYLGFSLKYNGNLSTGICEIKNQASRAMYSLINKAKKLNLAIDIQLQLFDSLVLPIALYGCEVWGCKETDIMEKLHLQFCKMLLKVNKCTTTAMVLGELGRYPIKYYVDYRMLCYWYRLVSGDKSKISYIMYNMLYCLDKNGIFNSGWISAIKQLLTKCELYNKYWLGQDSASINQMQFFKKLCKAKLSKYYEQEWRSVVQNSSKCALYKNFKLSLKLEKYLIDLDVNKRINLTRFRLSNHRLPIEVGRYNNTIRTERICLKCANYDICDEYHCMFICDTFKEIRTKFLP